MLILSRNPGKRLLQLIKRTEQKELYIKEMHPGKETAVVIPKPVGTKAKYSQFPVALWHGTSVYSMAYSVANGWEGPQRIDNGMLADQWTPQRCGWGYNKDGKAYWVQAETSSNDIEVWADAGTDWQISGSWAVVASSTANDYLAVDVHTRNGVPDNYLWIIQKVDATLSPYYFKCDDNSITDVANAPNAADNHNYSFTLTDLLQGAIHYGFIRVTEVTYAAQLPEGTMGVEGGLTAIATHPAIVSDNEHRLWCFYNYSGDIQYSIQDTNPSQDEWVDNVPVYATVDNFDGHYNVCHRPEDDTLHMSLVEWDISGSTYTFRLKYLRRTPNGWDPMTLDTWALSGAAEILQRAYITPQITSGPTGIGIYNLEYDVGDSNSHLKYYHLGLNGYDDPETSGSWSSGTADTGTQVWVGISAPENWPV